MHSNAHVLLHHTQLTMTQLTPLHSSKDRAVTGTCANWLNPDTPLPQTVLFFPHKPTVQRNIAYAIAIIAALGFIGAGGIAFVGGPHDFVCTLLSFAIGSTLVSAWSLIKASRSDTRYTTLTTQNRWRLGRFWSPDAYMIRLKPNDCTVIPRHTITRIYTGSQHTSLEDGRNQCEIWLGIDFNGTQLLEHSLFANGHNASDVAQKKQTMQDRKRLLELWQHTGDTTHIAQAQRLLDTQPKP